MEDSLLYDAYHSQDAILLTGMCYQTYMLLEAGGPVLPDRYILRHTLSASVGVTTSEKAPFAFIAESNDSIILAFRGTSDFIDLDSDLDIFQIPYPYRKDSGQTHRGMTFIYQSMRDELIRLLESLPPTKKLFMTGHSLGGDLALLAGLDIVTNTVYTSPVIYTLAAGRVGDQVFASQFNAAIKNSFRIYNEHDLIPTLPAEQYPSPFTEDGLAYQHVEVAHPLLFQKDNMLLNHRINCYFEAISVEDPVFTAALRATALGFCPDITVD
jgi:triacylglycerol lipase